MLTKADNLMHNLLFPLRKTDALSRLKSVECRVKIMVYFISTLQSSLSTLSSVPLTEETYCPSASRAKVTTQAVMML